MKHNKIALSVFLLSIQFLAVLSACSDSGHQSDTLPLWATTRPVQSLLLTPYHSPTVTVTPSPVLITATRTQIPSFTPTPRTHAVVKGEDMFGIALKYGISLDDLKTANPTINPQFLSIGSILTIPESKGPTPTLNAQGAAAVTATPLPVETGSMNCQPTEEGGAWCFLQVRNPYDYPLENISALIRLADSHAQSILEEQAFLPLDILPAGASMPLLAYFPPPLTGPFQADGHILTSLPHPEGDGRYLAVKTTNPQVTIEDGDHSAVVQIEVSLEQPEAQASQVRVAAIAYDAAGNIIGVRRWENQSAPQLIGRDALPVTIRIYSVQGAIDRVEVFAEARP